ncbi:thermonuclease family protein [Thermaerobacter litoralis]
METLAVREPASTGVPARGRPSRAILRAVLLTVLVLAFAASLAGCGTATHQPAPAETGTPEVAPSGRESGGTDGSQSLGAATGAASENAEASTGTGDGKDLSAAGRVQSAAEQPRAGITLARVVQVVDGDTIEVQPLAGAPLPATRIRLIGVNTPEIHGRVEPYGFEAARFTERQLAGRQVWLEKDVSETDRYGRALRYVWLVEPPADPAPADVRQSMFNAVLVREGYAQVATYPPDVRYADLLVELQREARQAGRGLWGETGGASAGGGGSRSGGSGGSRSGRAVAGAGSSGGGGRAGCDPAYPDVCIPPPPPDLDCGDLSYRNFRVLPPDPHRLDGRDRDGIGCES